MILLYLINLFSSHLRGISLSQICECKADAWYRTLAIQLPIYRIQLGHREDDLETSGLSGLGVNDLLKYRFFRSRHHPQGQVLLGIDSILCRCLQTSSNLHRSFRSSREPMSLKTSSGKDHNFGWSSLFAGGISLIAL